MRVLAGVPVPLSAVAKWLESNGRKHQGQSSQWGTALDVFVQFLSLGVKRAVSCLCGRGCRDSLPLHHRDETADDEQDDERQCAPSIHSAAAVEAASRRVDGHCLCRCTAPQCGEQHHSCHFLFHSLVVMIVLRVPVQVCSVLLLLLFLLFFGDSVQKMEESES